MCRAARLPRRGTPLGVERLARHGWRELDVTIRDGEVAMRGVGSSRPSRGSTVVSVGEMACCDILLSRWWEWRRGTEAGPAGGSTV